MQDKLELLKSDGNTDSLEVISSFIISSNGNDKKYILTTLNEIDQNGLIKILASEVVDNRLVKIESDDEWMLVKNVMRAIISSSPGDFTYYNFGTNLSFESDIEYARVIAIQDVAKQQLIKDFIEKRPNPEEKEVVEEEVIDPNQIIYPEVNNEQIPLDDEIVPGIAELTEDNINKEDTNLESDIPVNSNIELPKIYNDARNIMINKIIDAVDEYFNSINNTNEIDDLKTSINAIEEQLNKMNDSLKTHE